MGGDSGAAESPPISGSRPEISGGPPNTSDDQWRLAARSRPNAGDVRSLRLWPTCRQPSTGADRAPALRGLQDQLLRSRCAGSAPIREVRDVGRCR